MHFLKVNIGLGRIVPFALLFVIFKTVELLEPVFSKAQANLLKTDGVELYEISNYLLIIILTTVFEWKFDFTTSIYTKTLNNNEKIFIVYMEDEIKSKFQWQSSLK